jgi:S-adenosylmethionine:tRNA ribosyltransferase-isomerase
MVTSNLHTKLSDYDFDLPEELIAQAPVSPRDQSRLLVIDRRSQKISHHRFTDLPSFLNPGDLCVANNTQVLKARLLGTRVLDNSNQGGGKIEMLLLEKKEPLIWEGIFKSTGKQVPGFRFEIPSPQGPIFGEIIRGSQDSASGTITAKFNRDPVEVGAGELPLPPYISRKDANPQTLQSDLQNYQTVYAKNLGSAAAPTAGLHFTPAVLNQLKNKGILWDEVTLHVGLGTFRPVKTEDIRSHVMHEERYFVSESVQEQVSKCHERGNRVIAIGTTSVRTLESAADESKNLRVGEGRTQIFIYPGGREFRVVDALITNFHLPQSTLLMLVSAFAGRDLILRAYREAVLEKYRFFSYGDAMLIL